MFQSHGAYGIIRTTTFLMVVVSNIVILPASFQVDTYIHMVWNH